MFCYCDSLLRLDGIIFLEDVCPETPEYLRARKIPFAVVDSNRSALDYPAVCCDYEETAYAVTDYLIRKDHREVTFIGTQSVPDLHAVLLKGSYQAIEARGLTVSQCWIKKEQFNTNLSSTGMREILACTALPAAVLRISS